MKGGGCSSKEIFDNAGLNVSFATIKRMLASLISRGDLATTGKGKTTRYFISPVFWSSRPIDIDEYFIKDVDERKIQENFNLRLITEVLGMHSIFSKAEIERLTKLQDTFRSNIVGFSQTGYKKELERLAIDLSWKSSQIEGNTYSLLETEKLLKEKMAATGKTKEEAIMLLNHKEALDFIIDNKDYLHPLTVARIEDIHRILTKDLAVEKNIRRVRVGITGTNYKPLDNEFQISEALKNSCEIINNKESVFEKALLALLLISYIQPFIDGNKRTARIVCNAILMYYGYCPLSFRTVDSMYYKKAMILFYEQNNFTHFKQLFIDQFEFAVKTYF